MERRGKHSKAASLDERTDTLFRRDTRKRGSGVFRKERNVSELSGRMIPSAHQMLL